MTLHYRCGRTGASGSAQPCSHSLQPRPSRNQRPPPGSAQHPPRPCVLSAAWKYLCTDDFSQLDAELYTLPQGIPNELSLHRDAAGDILRRQLSSTQDRPIDQAAPRIAEVVVCCRRLGGGTNGGHPYCD
eukprot:scaffold129955_cov28-Prasinocladus_malaysianus.AAC.1